MAARIVILGGGVGGTLAANLLAKQIPESLATITVADRTGKHVYQPGWLYLPFGREQAVLTYEGNGARELFSGHPGFPAAAPAPAPATPQ